MALLALVILPMSSVLVLAFVSIVFMSLSLKISWKELNVKYSTSLDRFSLLLNFTVLTAVRLVYIIVCSCLVINWLQRIPT